MSVPLIYAAADGEVLIALSGPLLAAVARWAAAAGIELPRWMADEDWATWNQRLREGAVPDSHLAEIVTAIQGVATRTPRAQLFEDALAAGGTIVPVNTAADILSFPQLEERAYWESIVLPNGDRARAPGSFVKIDGEPLPTPAPAPRVGEHTDEILREGARSSAANRVVPEGRPPALPLEGLKVADFSWVGVGPIAGKYLADHGATVVRVESPTRPDSLRAAPPATDGVPGVNRSQFYGGFNTSKLSLMLDFASPEGFALAKRLIGCGCRDRVVPAWRDGAARAR